MSRGLTWLIERAYQVRASDHLNSPTITEWRKVREVRAPSRTKAMDRAVEVTGAPRSELRVIGIHVGGR